MPFKALLGRPATSANSNRKSAFFDSRGTTPKSSQEGLHKRTTGTTPKSSQEGLHKRTGSWKRLSLSLSPTADGTFHQFLTQEPEQIASPRSSIGQASSQGSHAIGQRETRTSASRLVLSTNDHAGQDGSDPRSKPKPKPKTDAGEGPGRQQRFSLRKFRYASDPQLSTRFQDDARTQTPAPAPPQIIMTAPTTHQSDSPTKRKAKDRLFAGTFSHFRRSQLLLDHDLDQPSDGSSIQDAQTSAASTPNLQEGTLQGDPEKRRSVPNVASPPAYGDDSGSALAIPISRVSDSSRSEGSSESQNLYARTTTTHVVSTTTTFFKLKRKKKDKGPLFPLPERLPRPASARVGMAQGAESNPGRRSMSPGRKSTQAVRFDTNDIAHDSPFPSPTHSTTAITNAPHGSPGPAVVRKHSTLSATSGTSTPTGSLFPPRLGTRGRSSTMGSLGRSAEKLVDGPFPPAASTRTSTSTSGRRSFGDILSLSQRLRQNSAPPRHASTQPASTPGSKPNSVQLPREPEPELVYPPREDEDTPGSYLEKLEAAVPRGAMASILCKSGDEFAKTCLRKYMRGFPYFGESIDMAIRKMLMEVTLPKETQQIDRLLAGFADRYHECNPGIFVNTDEANFVAFSILLLQSDSHNRNNKHKMTKTDYVKNTQNGPISVNDDVLECFYDNVCYTPFIHLEDEVAVNSHRLAVPKAKKSLIKSRSSESLRGPVDPYSLILDNKLDALRPPLKATMETEETYSASGTSSANSNEHHAAFVSSAVLQIVSARSRPDAFMTQATITNPAEAQAGLVSIKVAKVGLLWRKSTKKKKAKSPWQEWGVILTDSKLYFFKDVGWVRKLIAQYDTHTKLTGKRGSLVFNPPVTAFEPNALLAMDDAVALMDMSYKKHKNAFTFIKHGGLEETFLANSEADMNDWIGKLNYAAAFRTAGVRMRGLLGNSYEGRTVARQDSELSVQTTSTQPGEKASPSGKPTSQMAWEIMFYRRQLISEKISTFDDHLAVAQKELDYLLRNARHLVILLPVQQKTRDALVLAAGRMNAKLKWTRKEIWRTRTHRDILIKDLEAEANLAFPAPPPTASGLSVGPAAPQATPNEASQLSLARTKTDHANVAKSPVSLAVGGSAVNGGRRPSQVVLGHITTDGSAPPELTAGRKRSASNLMSPSPRSGPSNQSAPSLLSPPPSRQDADGRVSPVDGSDERAPHEASLTSDHTPKHEARRGSESERDRATATSPSVPETPVRERVGSVRRSLQKTLREAPHPHRPGHSRSKKSKESGSSLTATEDARPIESVNEELRRDPTGRFVLHGKKASVITMGPEWHQMSNEDRLKLKLQESEKQDGEKQDVEKQDDERQDGDKQHREEQDREEQDREEQDREEQDREEQDTQNVDVSTPPTGPVYARSSTMSVHSAVTHPGEVFHSANSSRRSSMVSSSQVSDDSQRP